MTILIFLLGLLLSFGPDSLAQTYRYVDRKGTVCFTDNPSASPYKGRASKEEQRPQEKTVQERRSKSEIKDILQLGQEALEEELAKPPEKQNRRLIEEMKESLYGDVSGKKSK